MSSSNSNNTGNVYGSDIMLESQPNSSFNGTQQHKQSQQKASSLKSNTESTIEQRQDFANICKYEREISKKQGLRTLVLILLFSLFFFLVITHNKSLDLTSLLYSIVFSIIFGVIYFVVGVSIFTPYLSTNRKENECLVEMKKDYIKRYNR